VIEVQTPDAQELTEAVIATDREVEEVVFSNDDIRSLARAQGWPRWARPYLAALATHGQKTKAAADSMVARIQVLRLRRTDPAFVMAEQAAMNAAMAFFESEAIRRATEGVVEERFDRNGRVVARRVVYSDAIMLRLLERMQTGSWQQKTQLEVGGPGAFNTLDDLEKRLSGAKLEISEIPTGEVGESQQARLPEPESNVPQPLETQQAQVVENQGVD
jgi:hypothetical protein